MSRRSVYAALVLVMGIWGGAFVAVKAAMRPEGAAAGGVDWIELTWLRYAASAALLLGIALAADPAGVKALLSRQPGRAFLSGALGVAGYNLALNYGETQVPATVALLVIPVNPVLVMLMASAFLGEALTPRRWLGSGLAVLGLAAVVLAAPRGTHGWGSAPGSGIAACLFAALAWAGYALLSKTLTETAGPVAVAGVTTALGTLPILPVVLWQSARELGSPLALGTWHARAWDHLTGSGPGPGLWLLYLVLASTVVAFLLYQWGIQRLPAGTVASFIYLMPVFGVAWGAWALGEKVTPWQLAGAGVLLAGVALAASTGRPARRAAPPASRP